MGWATKSICCERNAKKGKINKERVASSSKSVLLAGF